MIEEIILSIFALINFVLIVAVYKNNPKSKTNQFFSALVFVLTAYLVVNAKIYDFTDDYYWRLFFARAIMAAASLINLYVYLFLATFPETKLKINRKLVVVLHLVTAGMFFSCFTNLVFTDIEISDGNVITPVQGKLMPLFGLHTLGLVLGGLISILKKYKKSKGEDRLKIKYVFFAFFLLLFLILTLNFLLPVVFKIGNFVPFLPLYILLFLIIVSYAILKHKLLDIRLIVARSVVFTLLLLITSLVYVVVLFFIGGKLFNLQFSTELAVISIVLTLISSLSFPGLKRNLEVMTDKLLYRDNYDSVELRESLVKIMAYTLRLADLISKLRKKIEKEIKIEKSTFILKVDNEIIEKRDKFDLSKEETKYLLSLKRNIVFEELAPGKLKDLMSEKGISLIFTLHTKELGRFGIYVLGSKKSGDIYSENDVDFLNNFALEVSVAIANSLSYEEIQQFAKTLKKEVADATQKLKLANIKLKELDKLKDEFLNVAAHELRAPLTAVKGYLSMISEGDAGKVNKQVRQFLDGALEGTEREIRLVNNMLNMSRIEEKRLVYNMGEVEMSDVVNFAFEEFKAQAEEKGLEFDIYVEKKIKDLVYVDRDRIYEVVANLISNAIKYTDKGSVQVKLFNSDPKIIRFEVIDTGYGINKKEQDKLFTKFFRSESSAGKVLGTGLGLYIVKLLIEKFKGKFGMESELGKGSTFWFELKVR